MLRFIIRRFLIFLPMLWLISVISFVIIQLPPGSYVENRIVELQQLGGDASSQERVEQLKSRYGLDRPLWRQYAIWIKGIVTHFDFGESFHYDRNVNELVWSYLGYTLLISVLSLLVTYLLAILLGVIAAVRRYQWPDLLISGLSFLGMACPEFLLGLLLLAAGIFWLNRALVGLYSPALAFQPWSGARLLDLLAHLPIPVAIVAINGTAGLMRIMRGNLIETLGQQYVRAAFGRGLSPRRVFGFHALRMAINPMVSIIGMSLPSILSGSVIISIIMNLPTAGLLLFESLRLQDMYLAGSLILMFSFLLLLGNLLADLALALIDPRIRYE